MKPTILILDDEAAVRTSFSFYLARRGFAVAEAGTLAEARQAMMSQSVDGLLLDVSLPDGNGLDWIREVREARPGTAIVVMSGIGDVPMAVQAMREGADHFVTKPVNMADLEVFLRKSLELGGLRRGSRAVQRQARKAAPFFGESPAACALGEQARLALQHDAPVLLQGETGTGKGVLARWLHEHGTRDGMPFVEISCAGLPRDLLASELFGHARGAFTSAVADKEGLLDVADGGTLFLDEIGELDAATAVAVPHRAGGRSAIAGWARCASAAASSASSAPAAACSPTRWRPGASGPTSTSASTCCPSRSRRCATAPPTCPGS